MHYVTLERPGSRDELSIDRQQLRGVLRAARSSGWDDEDTYWQLCDPGDGVHVLTKAIPAEAARRLADVLEKGTCCTDNDMSLSNTPEEGDLRELIAFLRGGPVCPVCVAYDCAVG